MNEEYFVSFFVIFLSYISNESTENFL